jgi:TonB family protein
VAVALGFRRRLQTGPALRIAQVPLASLTLSALLHAALIVAAVIAVNAIKESQPKIYVVNLVPAVPAIGRPEGRAAKAPPSTARPELPPPSTKSAEQPELPTRESAAPARELPPRATARESVGLPDRALPPRSAAPATSRTEQKELPSVASSAPSATTPSATTSSRVTSTAPPAALGVQSGSTYGKGKLTIDVDFPYAWYIKIIRDKIGTRWDPYALPGQQPLVAFEIARNGEVNPTRIRVMQSSGNRAYDQVAVRAIADSSPFPPLPDDFKDVQVRIVIQFLFEADRG